MPSTLRKDANLTTSLKKNSQRFLNGASNRQLISPTYQEGAEFGMQIDAADFNVITHDNETVDEVMSSDIANPFALLNDQYFIQLNMLADQGNSKTAVLATKVLDMNKQ